MYRILYGKWKTERLYGYKTAVSLPVVYPHDHAAGWAAWLLLPSITAGHHSTHASLGKKSKSEILSMVSTECIALLHHRIIVSQTIVKLGTIHVQDLYS